MKPVPRVTPTRSATAPPATLTEEAAAQAMWHYYRDHKLQLIADIRDHRASMLTQLMAGVEVEDVFGPYAKPGARPVATAPSK